MNLTPHIFSGNKFGWIGRYKLVFYAIRKILTLHHHMYL